MWCQCYPDWSLGDIKNNYHCYCILPTYLAIIRYFLSFCSFFFYTDILLHGNIRKYKIMQHQTKNVHSTYTFCYAWFFILELLYLHLEHVYDRLIALYGGLHLSVLLFLFVCFSLMLRLLLTDLTLQIFLNNQKHQHEHIYYNFYLYVKTHTFETRKKL